MSKRNINRVIQKVKKEKYHFVSKIKQIDKFCLLIEDEETILNYLKQLMINFNYKVLTATNGKNALKQYNQDFQKIKLLIVDFELPDMTGIEVIEAIRQKELESQRHFQVPIIITSGNTGNYLKEEANNVGAMFVSKPITAKELEKIVDEFLQRF